MKFLLFALAEYIVDPLWDLFFRHTAEREAKIKWDIIDHAQGD